MGGIRSIFDDPYLTLLALGLGFGFLTIFACLLIPRIPTGSLAEFGNLFLGVEVPPLLVGWVRAVTSAAVTGAVTKVGAWAGVGTDPAILTGLVYTACGTLWAALDQWKKRKQNAFNPPAVAGGPDLLR